MVDTRDAQRGERPAECRWKRIDWDRIWRVAQHTLTKITVGFLAGLVVLAACSNSAVDAGPILLMSGSDAGSQWKLYFDEQGDRVSGCILAEDLEEPACEISVNDPSQLGSALSFNRFTLSPHQGPREYVGGVVSSEVDHLEARFSDGSTSGIPIGWVPGHPIGFYLGVFEADPEGRVRVEAVAVIDDAGKVLEARR